MEKRDYPRYVVSECIDFAQTLLQRAGLQTDYARTVAETLVEADLLGHTTHGLQLLAPYIQEIEKGQMKTEGQPLLVQDRGASIAWNGQHLPGPWLVHRALDLALGRLQQHPVVTLVIRQSHHIACLACYLERATRQNVMILLASSDAANKTVAPFGAVEGVYSPDPIAVGIPTEGAPILMDISMSTTANGVVIQKHRNAEQLPHPWLLKDDGSITEDPQSFFDDPPATILPIGGLDHGYKGFGLGLMIEALTHALAGGARHQGVSRWEASVFLQLINPEAFGGKEAFLAESSFLANACRNAKTSNGAASVRLPGDRGRALRQQQLRHGLYLYPTIKPSLEEMAERYHTPFPASLPFDKASGGE